MMDAPVSTALESELTTALRQRGIVVWLDKDGEQALILLEY